MIAVRVPDVARRTIDRFTRSAANYRLAPIADMAGTALFLAAGLQTPMSPVAQAAAIAAGAVAWMPLEYALHRWLGHGPPTVWRRGHAMHHADDTAFVAAPMFVVPAGALTIWAAISLAVPAGLAGLFVGGTYAGYNYYTLLHHLFHHHEDLVRRIGGEPIIRRHRFHHVHQNVNFGVTSSLCDRLFGTYASDERRLGDAFSSTSKS